MNMMSNAVNRNNALTGWNGMAAGGLGCGGGWNRLLLTDREKKEIMREGFNQYTHDFLLRRHEAISAEQRRQQIMQESADENVVFPLEPRFLDLEYKAGEPTRTNPKTKEIEPIPDVERWCFFVAKDSMTLKMIGSEMSNCVG